MASPWKELLDFYQQKEDSRIKYEQIVEQFQPAGLTDPALLLRGARARSRALQGELASAICRWPRTTATASSTRSRFSMRLDEHVAVIGPERQRQERAGAAAGAADAADRRPHHDRRARPRRSCRWPWSAAASAMLGATPYLFTGTLRDNLLLGLRHRPVRPAEYETRPMRAGAPASSRRRAAPAISISTCTPTGSITTAAGVANAEELSARIVEMLARLDFEADVYNFGLRWRFDAGADPELTARLLEARRALARPPRRRRASPSWSRPTIPSATTRTPAWRKTCCSAPRSAPSSISRRWPTTLTSAPCSTRSG